MSAQELAIVGPATWAPMVPLLTQACQAYGGEVAVRGYGFGEDVPVLAGQHPGFLAQAPEGVFIIQDARVLFRSWLRDPRRDGDPAADGVSAARLVIDSLVRLAPRLPHTSWVVATLAPPHPNTSEGLINPAVLDPFTAAVAAFNREVWAAWDARKVYVLDMGLIQAEWGTRVLFDSRMDQLARFFGSVTGTRIVAERMGALWAAITGRMKKVLALDCDNTLWGGIIAEDGVDGIQLGEDGPGRAFTMFQEALLSLEARGVLLTLCSRNNPQDVEDVFARRSEMLLPRDRIAAVSIGWEAKSTGLQALAQQLGLGLDAFVFIDDSPQEREEVRHALPMVTVPEFPQDPADLPTFAAELGWRWFLRVHLADEDRQKTKQYRVRAATEQLRHEAVDPTEFLRSLRMTSTIHVNDPDLVFRVAQLTQKTNQFNLTLRRHTEAEVREMIATPSWHLFAASLGDRFGDHGIVATLIAHESSTAWTIDSLLMSCRVLGRGFERAFATAVIRRLRERKMLPIEGEFVRGPRNAQVEHFYQQLGFVADQSASGQQSLFSLPTDVALQPLDDTIELCWRTQPTNVDQLCQTVMSVLGLNADEVSDDTSMENCARWDSLQHFHVILAVEKAFGVRFSSERILDLTSIRALRQELARFPSCKTSLQ